MIYHKAPQDFSPRFEVVSCFVEYESKILLLQVTLDKFQGGRWGVPAGKVEKGEDLQDAMLRELYEETGLNIGKTALKFLSTVFVRYNEYDFIFHMYKVILANKTTVTINNKEHIDHIWVTPQEALAMDLIQDEDACIKFCYYH